MRKDSKVVAARSVRDGDANRTAENRARAHLEAEKPPQEYSRKLKLRGLRRSPDVEKVNESRTVVDFGEDRVPVREPLLTTSKFIGLFPHTVALPCPTLSPLIH